MDNILKYGIFAIFMVVLQVFLFSRIGISVYVHPLVYIAFILLLPMEMSSGWVLVLGLLLGVTVDFFTGTPAINTIATLAVAISRQSMLYLFVGKDEVKDGGIPYARRLGNGRFLTYITSMVLLHSIIYFCFEALAWEYFYLVLLRIVVSSAISVILIYYIQLFFIKRIYQQ